MATLQDVIGQGQNAIAEGAKPADVANWIKQWQAAPEYTHNNSFADMFNNRNAALKGTLALASGGGTEQQGEVDLAGSASMYKAMYGIDPSQEIDPNAWVGRAYASNLLGLKSGSSAHTPSEANGFDDNGNANSWTNNSAEDAITMAQLKRIDPNATIDAQGNYQFDQSKLPQFMGGKVNPDASKYGGWVQAPIHTGQSGHVLDKNAVFKDPIYGELTYRKNTFDPAQDGDGGFMGQLGKYMPSVISAVMSMASGIPVASLVQGVAAADSGGWKGVSMDNLLASIAGMIANQYLPGASTAINLANNSLNRKP